MQLGALKMHMAVLRMHVTYDDICNNIPFSVLFADMDVSVVVEAPCCYKKVAASRPQSVAVSDKAAAVTVLQVNGLDHPKFHISTLLSFSKAVLNLGMEYHSF